MAMIKKITCFREREMGKQLQPVLEESSSSAGSTSSRLQSAKIDIEIASMSRFVNSITSSEQKPVASHRQEETVTSEIQTSGLTWRVPELEIQISGLTGRVQEHGSKKNLQLLKYAYPSKKGKASAYRNFPAPAWRENEDDFLQQVSPLGNTVLHIAARYDDWVDEIAEKAPHLLTTKNSNGDTALHVAAKAGHISTLKSLLAARLRNLQHSYSENPQEALNEILVKNKQGNTFFHEALLNSQKQSVNLRDFLASDEEQSESESVFKALVERAALFSPNDEGKSVFFLAIEAGNWNVFSQALDKLTGHDPALDELIENHKELDKLIPHGPDYVPTGKSPLLAAIMKRDQDILNMMLQKKPEWLHLTDTEERTPLHYAASIGCLRGVQYLLGMCISCAMERDIDGFFPIHLASDGGHVEVVQKLLQHCPDPIEILDNSGRNILHVAVESGKFNVVSYILQAADHELGKMINDKDVNGNTPLHLATLRCHPKIVHALTRDKRVDLNLVNGQDQTALDAFMQISLENPSLRQRLTWIALKSTGVKFSIKVPKTPESCWEQKNPKMDPYKDRFNTLMLVSTLITTVTFAAGFTMPGGTNNSDPGQQGMALLLNQIWFKLFIFFITVSMYGSISVTIILIFAQLGDILLAIFALEVARPLLGVTLTTLSLAFLAGVHLVISDLSWLATTFLVIGVFFIFMLLLLYILLWFPSSSSWPVVRFFSHYPFRFLVWLDERDAANGNRRL